LLAKLKRCGNGKDSTPLPWPQLSVVMVVSLSEGVTASILLPFVAFMITDLFKYPVSDVGYYGGWLTSAYFLSQVFSSVILGQLSDVKGRRIIMLTGMLGNLVTTLIFGLSRVFWLAILSRFICGLVNGNIGVIKSYIREVTDQTNQARGYTLRSAGYSIGTILGPILGGALARPALQYPSLFSSTGMFAYFPFLLPCIASAFISLLSFLLGFFFLKETVVQPIVDADVYSSDELELSDRTTSPDPENDGILSEPENDQISSQDDSVQLRDFSSNQENEMKSIGLETTRKDEDMVELDPELSSQVSPASLRKRNSWWYDFKIFGRQLWNRLEFFKKALGERDVVLSMLLYAAVAFVQLGFDEVFAFWAIRPIAQGGIGFTTLQIGTAHALSGVGMLIMQIFAYVPMDRSLGTQNTLTLSMALTAPAFVIISFANLVAAKKVLLWFVIILVMFMKAGFGTTGFAAVNLLVSNAAGSETVGAVNGLSASIAAIARVLAPVVIGSLFAATANATVGFPFDYHFVFFFIAAISCLTALGSHFTLPETINQRKS
jgi:MFS family permease